MRDFDNYMQMLKKNEMIRVATILTHNPKATALLFMKNEMDKIRLQFSRIKQDEISLKILNHQDIAISRSQDESFQEQRQKKQTSLFADIHFLLISLTNFIKIFHESLVQQLPANNGIMIIDQKYYKTTFKEYTDFRNNLEHIEYYIDNIHDYGNLDNDKFTFNGKTFVLGSNRESEIEAIFSEILIALEKPSTQ